jgi:hypothetical protein
MTTRPRSQEFPGAFAYEQTAIRARPTIREWRQLDAQQPRRREARRAVAAIQMIGYRVIVTEHRTRGLVDSDGTTYISPPQTEEQARSLIALLAGVTAAAGGAGP